MCGVAGIFAPGRTSGELKQEVLRMASTMIHRGPDDDGSYADDAIALAHTRLSVIDIAGGRQPLSNEDGTIHLVVNGEIYNYKSLQKRLLQRGHRLLTQSDCEVIVHLYEDEGEECLRHLDGMFAFALWDARHKKLLLARDRFGIKPLYVAISEKHIYFASELTAILHSRMLKAEIDHHALYAYLTFSYVPGPLSIFKGIEKLLPSERLIAHDGSVQRDIYWMPKKLTVPRGRALAAKELARCLEEGVRSHLVADVPIAAFLSGGVDSSSVVAMAQRHTRMDTFCVSFPNTEIDEAPIARRVADHLGTRHQEVKIEINPVKLLTEAVKFMDEPFADSSALPTLAVCGAARKIAKVVLSGDGGDEVFGGYTGRYRVAALKAAIPKPDIIARALRGLPPWSSGRRRSLPEMLELAALPDVERYILERQITTVSDRAALFGHSKTVELEASLREIPTRPLSKVSHWHPVHRALWMDLMTSLSDDMLTKVDRMSMAHGLEVRVPLLDHHIVEFALSMPPEWLVSPLPLEGKRLVRQVIAPRLPNGVLNRPKRGFVIPLNAWLRDDFLVLFDSLCLGSDSYLAGLFDLSAIRALRNKPFGKSPRQDLYALLILELWFRRIRDDEKKR
jgi:asparagine synthase (glutamine-hydrolysing)